MGGRPIVARLLGRYNPTMGRPRSDAPYRFSMVENSMGVARLTLAAFVFYLGFESNGQLVNAWLIHWFDPTQSFV